MPTTVTNSIGPGKTYATIQAWMDAAGTAYPSGLTTADVIWKGELYPSSGGNEWTFTSSNTFPSIATDATRYFLITAAPGYSFTDNANKLTNALKYNSANGVSLSFSGNYTTLFANPNAHFQIQNLQIKKSSGLGNVSNTFGSGSVTYSNCIFYTASAVPSGQVYKNCLFIASTIGSAGGASAAYNCTFVNFNTGTIFSTNNYSQVTIKNCAIFGYTAIIDDVSKIVAASSTYNATDLASFGWSATGNIVSKTYANQFQNVTSGTEDFRVKAGADLIGVGIRDQTNTNDLDIVGSARSLTTPTIGAWEFASAPPPSVTDYSSPMSRGIFRGIERGVA
jgi:hypothetical protein